MSNIHKNFNSRTRVGATKKQLGGRIGLLVSIHAPVWVRLYDVYIVIGLLEFQFTHPCGCDINSKSLPRWVRCFNSRTRVGATPYLFQLSAKHDVSIHAPVWVRLSRTCGPTQSNWFQFTHPCGCDRPNSEQCVPLSGFQFTHPCGCDRLCRPRCSTGGCFNSRTRVGATASHQQIRR